MAHTPGPWWAARYGSPADHWYVRGVNGERVLGAAKPLTNADDVHLIAAAPELSAALAGLLAASSDDGSDESAVRLNDAQNAAQAAIRKALSDGSEARTGGEEG